MKKIINTDKAPAAIGTYSQAVVYDGVLYTSGQIPIDPKTGDMLPADFSRQAHQVFKNLQAVAEAAGSGLQNAIKLNVYLQDLNDFAGLNEIMSGYLSEPYPARAAVQVARLPKDSLIEIDAIIAMP
ncbi:RidA family protein [Marinicella gelatinilytica]|uniref:RidA family protein n=1 Tax=Marinicella gelatinilytica TaxID=2996017 RepID=UPI002260E885|nr:RidA family protein [Marinicella gelatinilytica]MCX7545528.1 RidA family protein [Marinicella gelatinilytica]